MWRIPQLLGMAALAGGVLLAPQVATAETDGRDASAVRRAEQTVERLRADLARVNAEVAELKRGERSIRNDYRLRERMADAEALAQKLTAAEANLRARGGASSPASGGAPVVASPQVSPQDGSVELEAKADLLADQARKLDGEAAMLAKAAEQLRTRKALRRKAGSWERDPFSGLETSKRNVAAAAPAPQKQPLGGTGSDSSARGTTSSGSPPPVMTVDSTGASGGPPAAFAPVTTVSTESAGKAGVSASASDAKPSPQPPSGLADRQALEQRLYLDPATAAELRQALGAGGAALDPDALERGAAALRARARVLDGKARALRVQSRAP